MLVPPVVKLVLAGLDLVIVKLVLIRQELEVSREIDFEKILVLVGWKLEEPRQKKDQARHCLL